MKLCILGMGSSECRTLEKRLKDLTLSMGYDFYIDSSDDIDLFLKHGITKTPALLINDFLVHNKELEDVAYLQRLIIEGINENDNYHKAS